MFERYFNTRAQSGNRFIGLTAPSTPEVKEQQIELCRDLTSRITRDMNEMRHSTEEAALCIGELLDQIVKTATEGNNQLQSTLSAYLDGAEESTCETSSQESLHKTIDRQSRVITSLVQRMQEFFDAKRP